MVYGVAMAYTRDQSLADEHITGCFRPGLEKKRNV